MKSQHNTATRWYHDDNHYDNHDDNHDDDDDNRDDDNYDCGGGLYHMNMMIEEIR